MKVIASLLPVLAFAAATLSSAEAAAQRPAGRAAPAPAATTTRTADYTEQSLAGDQVVTFTGDELAAPPNGAYGAMIRPLPGAVRVGLIRPRVNFVSELLKSVENL